MDYTIKIDNFQGPLDLLLYFIQRDKINMYDISINHITKEYLNYINMMKDLNIEIAGEFILMASMLMKIKSRMLLPRYEKELDEEIEDPRQELIDRLVEYKKYKYASEEMKEILEMSSLKYEKGIDEKLDDEQLDLSSYYKDYSVFDLVMIFNNIINKSSEIDLYQTEIEQFTINEKSIEIMSTLNKKKEIIFSEIIKNISSKIEQVVIFLALLDLMKNNSIKIVQNDVFAKISIIKK